MEVSEFKRILENGMGRAILHLKNHDPKPYHSAILDVCLHNPVLDLQSENADPNYTWNAVHASKNYSFFRQQIFERFLALDDSDDVYDIEYLYSLMSVLGARGVKDAIKAIHQKFLENPGLGTYEGASAVVMSADDISGLVLVAETLGADAYEYAGWETGRRLFRNLEYRYTEGELWDRLEWRAETDTQISAYVEAVKQKQAETNQRRRDKLTDYASVQTYIEGLEKSARYITYGLVGWGKQATTNELNQTAQDLITEKDPIRLQAYLKIFELTPFPLDTSPIRDLLNSDSERLARAAIRALANTDGARELGLELIAQNKWRIYAGELFRNKIEEDDWKLFADLATLPLSRDDYHSFWISTHHLTDPLTSAAIPLILNAYEQIPCGFCREGIVSNLHELGAAPDWMWEECRFDRNLDLRKLARKQVHNGNK